MKCQFAIILMFYLLWGSSGSRGADCPASRADLAQFAQLSQSWLTNLPWYPDGVLPQMLAHWPLDGNAADNQNTFDGVVGGNPTWIQKQGNPTEVKVGTGALGLDGSDYLEISPANFPQLSGSFTLEAWIKTSFTQGFQAIMARGASWQLGLEMGTGRALFSCPGISPSYLIGTTSVADGKWHHLAGVYDQQAQKIYIYLDGQIHAQATAIGQLNPSDLHICIGGNPQAAVGWHGILDDIRIYNYALSLAQVFQRQTWHVDGKTGMDVTGQDPEWGHGRQKGFRTIQYAIDAAADGDIILVWPAIYRESLFYMGKALTIRSAADAAVLMPAPADPDQIAVTFMHGEQAGSLLENFIIVNSATAIWVHQSSPTLQHLTLANNTVGLASIFNSHPKVANCIFWNNAAGEIIFDTYLPEVSYSCVRGGMAGTGNLQVDPLFANPDSSDPNTMDFHLQSTLGRYVPAGTAVPRPQPENWVSDAQTSPCIDAGPPAVNPFCETMCNGGRINIGAHGNSRFASKSPWGLAADLNYDGRIDQQDLLLFVEIWLQ